MAPLQPLQGASQKFDSRVAVDRLPVYRNDDNGRVGERAGAPASHLRYHEGPLADAVKYFVFSPYFCVSQLLKAVASFCMPARI